MEKGRDLASCSLGIYFDHVTYMFFLSNFSEKNHFRFHGVMNLLLEADFLVIPFITLEKLLHRLVLAGKISNMSLVVTNIRC